MLETLRRWFRPSFESTIDPSRPLCIGAENLESAMDKVNTAGIWPGGFIHGIAVHGTDKPGVYVVTFDCRSYPPEHGGNS